MKGQLLLVACLAFVLVLPSADGWRRRRRRRRQPPPAPRPVPPPVSPQCQALINRYTVVSGNNLFDLAKHWAPLVHLAVGEPWRPSSVDYFLRHVNVLGGPNPQPLTSQNLPRCNAGCFLKSKQSLGCASCTNPHFLRGQAPSHAPVYTSIHSAGNVVQITYRFFYPYNRGKRVCIGYYANNPCVCVFGKCVCTGIRGCIGGYSTFGNHVGDWEHVKIRFENNRLHSMFLSTHNSKITRKFGGSFLWNGRTFHKGGRELKMSHCTHGVIYSAAGSHGIWPSVGRNVYMKLPNGDTLVDYTSKGDAWNTWQNLKITMEKPRGQYKGDFAFMNFEGRWGNPKEKCGIAEKLFNECVLNPGPRRSV